MNNKYRRNADDVAIQVFRAFPYTRMKKLTCFVLFLIFVACVCHKSRADEQSVSDLLNRVLLVQNLIKSGNWVVKTCHQSFGTNKHSYDATFHIEFDGEKIRIQRDIEGRTTVYCSPYVKTTQSFFFGSRPKFIVTAPGQSNHLKIPDIVTGSLIVYEKENFDKLYATVGISEDTTIPCIKTMGFVTDDIFFQKKHFVNLSTYLKRFDVKNSSSAVSITIAQEEFKGVLCTVVSLSIDGPVDHISVPSVVVLDKVILGISSDENH